MAVAEVLVGAASAAFLGRSALPTRRSLSPPNLAEDLVLGLTLSVPLTLAWGVAGLPWGPVSMPALALALAGLLRMTLVRKPAAVATASAPTGLASLASWALLVLCLLVATGKLVRAPLWSWDHFAMWGMKARRLVVDGAFDLEFLKFTKRIGMNPQYPMGLPVAWRFLSPSMPREIEFRMFHALFAGGLVAALYACARRLGASPDLSRVAAAGLCASPLFWDTANLGLAEVPLACAAVVAVLLILEARDDPGFPAWTAGAALGFLAWIKAEGLVLGALLLAFAFVGGPASRWPWRRRASLLASWSAWSLAALAVRRFWLSPGMEFLTGDWSSRVALRLRDTGPILKAMLGNLTGTEWFGLWFLFVAATVAVFALRPASSHFLCLAVLGQFASYAFVYLGTFYGPVEHIQSSFHRLAAGLAPLAILAVVGVAGALRETTQRA